MNRPSYLEMLAKYIETVSLKQHDATCMFKFSVHGAPKVELKGYVLLWQIIPLQIFWSQSFTNFIWSILENFDSNISVKTCQNGNCIKEPGKYRGGCHFLVKNPVWSAIRCNMLRSKVRKSERPEDFKTWSHNSSKPSSFVLLAGFWNDLFFHCGDNFFKNVQVSLFLWVIMDWLVGRFKAFCFHVL